MNRAFIAGLSLVALVPLICVASDEGRGPSPADAPPSRVYVDLDLGWRFHAGDAPTAMEPGFDDAGWRSVNIPHDWSVEGPFEPGAGKRQRLCTRRRRLVPPAHSSEPGGGGKDPSLPNSTVSMTTAKFGSTGFSWEAGPTGLRASPVI